MPEGKQFKPVRVKATTKESAIEQALQMTGAEATEVEIEVLEESANGVTVRVSPLQSAAPAATPAAAQPAVEPAVAGESPAETETESAPESTFEEAMEAEETFESASQSASENSVAETENLASSAVQDRAREVAQDLLSRMGLDAEAKIAAMPEGVGPLASSHPSELEPAPVEFGGASAGLPRTFLNIEGEDVGILIGKHGQTLRAFQYLLNLSLNNSAGDEGVYVMVDAGDYRSRRAVVLERAVQNAAERARREHRAVRMEPMPAHERRLVHLLLQAEKDLTTSSEGREPWRRVVVAPQGVRPSYSRPGGQSRRPRSNEGRSSHRFNA